MTKEQKQEFFDKLVDLCKSLEGETDNVSNSLRANAVSIMTMLLKEDAQ